jgi:hypothetical protein
MVMIRICLYFLATMSMDNDMLTIYRRFVFARDSGRVVGVVVRLWSHLLTLQ